MSATNNSNNTKVSLKDKITSHLPGHKNQDKNADGVPDRLEKNTAANSGHRTLSDKNGNGIPDSMEQRGLNQGLAGGLNDRNRNGIPDNLEGNQQFQNQQWNGQQLNGQQWNGQQLNGQQWNGQQLNGQQFNGQQFSGQQSQFTDLNQNGIPDQLEGNQQGFGFIGSTVATTSSFVDVREAPTVVERLEKPAVVHEVYKTEEVVQIQPVIERERERLDVYEVVQPIREREVIATEVRTATLPTQTRAVVVEDQSAFVAQRAVPGEFSTREVAATLSQTIENAPIVHETILHRVIEEVQPVIYKEIDRPILVQETLPIYEKIVEAPQAHRSVLPMRDLGTRTVSTTTSSGFTDLNRDGVPDQMQGGMYQTTGLQSGIQSQGFFGQNQGLYGQTQGQWSSNDLNGNGIPDNLEGNQFQSAGLQGQGLQGQGLQSQGFAQNQTYGQAQGLSGQNHRTLSDLNGNGIPDRMEKAHGLKDLNGNGIDDSLERRMNQTTINSSRTY